MLLAKERAREGDGFALPKTVRTSLRLQHVYKVEDTLRGIGGRVRSRYGTGEGGQELEMESVGEAEADVCERESFTFRPS